jgi:flagellar assembly factor FliW
MNLATENRDESTIEKLEIHMPFGLVGLPALKKFDLSPVKGSTPFLLMRATEGGNLRFIVIEPSGLISGYKLEVSDNDAEELQIRSAEDARILNIVTVHSPLFVTVNLVGPIVVNRNTLVAKQVIVVNAEFYSTRHVLIDERGGMAQPRRRRVC